MNGTLLRTYETLLDDIVMAKSKDMKRLRDRVKQHYNITNTRVARTISQKDTEEYRDACNNGFSISSFIPNTSTPKD